MDSATIARRFLSFTLVVDNHECIIDASNGIAMFGYEHKQLLGKPIGEFFPLVRDMSYRGHALDEPPYYIRENTFLLGDQTSILVESYFIPIAGLGDDMQYRVFTIAKQI